MVSADALAVDDLGTQINVAAQGTVDMFDCHQVDVDIFP